MNCGRLMDKKELDFQNVSKSNKKRLDLLDVSKLIDKKGLALLKGNERKQLDAIFVTTDTKFLMNRQEEIIKKYLDKYNTTIKVSNDSKLYKGYIIFANDLDYNREHINGLLLLVKLDCDYVIINEKITFDIFKYTKPNGKNFTHYITYYIHKSSDAIQLVSLPCLSESENFQLVIQTNSGA